MDNQMKPKLEAIQQLIHDENEMVNHRMNWFLILQGFMYAGIAFAWDKNSALCVVFSVVGMLSSVSVGILLRFGIKTIEKLEASVKNESQPVLGKGSKETSSFIHFLLPWNFLPILMTIAWAAIIYIRIWNVA